MKPHKDPEFTRRIMEAKTKLGFHYPIFIKNKYPEFTTYKIRNVVHNGIIDWKLLKAMEKLAGIKQIKNEVTI
jgi:hypothetical protein